ncbi:MAG: GntR family transcriptional regulator [Gemmatimonadales bacterium]
MYTRTHHAAHSHAAFRRTRTANPAPTCSPREGGWSAILSFQYPEGSKLDEVRLGTRLGVSRTPVREALGRLERRPRHRHVARGDAGRNAGRRNDPRTAGGSGGGRAFYGYDVRFHRALIIGSGSRTLIELLRNVYDRLLLCRRRTMGMPGRLDRSLIEHEAILGALERRNGDQAETMLRWHIRALREEFRASREAAIAAVAPGTERRRVNGRGRGR